MIRFGKRFGLACGLSLALWFAAPLVAAACSGSYNPNDAVLIAEGRVERVTLRPDLQSDPSGAFIPVEVAMRVERAHRGQATGTILFVDYGSLASIPGGAPRYAGGAGACGILDDDPTGRYALIVFTSRDDAGRLRVNRVAGAVFGAGPDDARVARFRQVLLPLLVPAALPRTGAGGGQSWATPRLFAPGLLLLTAAFLARRRSECQDR